MEPSKATGVSNRYAGCTVTGPWGDRADTFGEPIGMIDVVAGVGGESARFADTNRSASSVHAKGTIGRRTQT